MRKRNTCAATLVMLAVFPFQLFPRGIPAAGTEDRPAPAFSLSAPDDRVLSSTRAVPLPPSPERFTLRTLSRDFLKDAGQIWSYPVHIKTGDILPIAGLAGLTGLLIANDEGIFGSFQNYRDGHGWVGAVSPAITKMGGWGAYGTAGLFLGVGLIAGDHKATETGVLATSAMLQAGILVEFLKGIFGRRRPSYSDGVDHWSGPVGFFKRYAKENRDAYNSFPSGHATTAFSLATVLAMQYRKSIWVPILSYTVATGVGLSRLIEGRHWLSDCLVGGVIGHLVGRLVVLNHRQRYHLTTVAFMARGRFSFAFTFSR